MPAEGVGLSLTFRSFVRPLRLCPLFPPLFPQRLAGLPFHLVVGSRLYSVAVCHRGSGAVVFPLPSPALCGASDNGQEPFPSRDAVPLPSASVLFQKVFGLVYFGPDFFFINRLRFAEKLSRELRAVPLPPPLRCPHLTALPGTLVTIATI